MLRSVAHFTVLLATAATVVKLSESLHTASSSLLTHQHQHRTCESPIPSRIFSSLPRGSLSHSKKYEMTQLSATSRNTAPPTKSLTREKDIKNQQFSLGKLAFSLLPLTPETTGRRKTLLTEVVPGKIWTLDQIQGIVNVNVPVRSTIICLKSGGLFVNNPVAPTGECIDHMRALESRHGAVRYITLSSLALEHKGTAGAFARYFPKAQVYLQPGQFSFPINLPSQTFFPLSGRLLREIPANSSDAPWGGEIEHLSLNVRPSWVGGFAETAYFHRETKTLLVTDSVTQITDTPPAIITEDPRALLFHARDNMLDVVQDTPENRRKGWRRMVLFGFFFQPGGIDVKLSWAALRMLGEMDPEMRRLGDGAIPFDGGLYPWEWARDDRPSFRSLTRAPLTVAPILQTLLLNRDPQRVGAWVARVCEWPFTRVISSHMNNDVKAQPRDFRAAFSFLYEPKEAASARKINRMGAGMWGLFGTGGGSPSSKDVREAPRPQQQSGKSKSGSSIISMSLDGGGAGVGQRGVPVAAGDFPDGDIALLRGASRLLTSLGVLYPEALRIPQ